MPRWTPLLLLAIACHPRPEPCISGNTCGKGMECLANQCLLMGSDPVAPKTERYVVRPRTSAVVGAKHRAASAGVPLAVTLGSRVEGPVRWYLDFFPEWPGGVSIDRAFLVVEPVLDTPPSSHDVEVTAWRVAEPWTASGLTWLDQPDHDPPRMRGLARSSPPQVLRLDVTQVVRYWQDHPHDRHGLVLDAPAGSGHGVTFSTGAGAGAEPELEVYVSKEQE